MKQNLGHAIEASARERDLRRIFADGRLLLSVSSGFINLPEPMLKSILRDNPNLLGEQAELGRRLNASLDAAIIGDEEEAFGLSVMTPNSLRGEIATLLYLLAVPLPAYRAFLASAWGHDHRAVISASGNRNRLRAMFVRAQFPLPEEWPATVRVWRGTSALPLPACLRGISWTTDRDTACWFAMRFSEANGSPLVVAADVPRDAILFHSNDRQEHEAVCFDVPNARIDGDPKDWQEAFARIEHSRGCESRKG